MRRLCVVILIAGLFRLSGAAASDVIIDHDGDADDLIAILLLLRSPNVHIRAIAITPGNSYLEPATRATQLFLERAGARDIPIAQGHSAGTNPFPAKWRADASRLLKIAALASVSTSRPSNPVVAADAPHYLVKALSGDQTYTILETGPLTNIAGALRLDPSIKKHIDRIYVMGGAVRTGGNVEQKGHDGSAEWNFFNQPQAAADVVLSGIPITLVALDATNKTPLTQAFLDRLGKQTAIASQLAVQSWRPVVAQVGNDQYFFWDTLTAAALLEPGVVRTERLKIRVITTGTSQGRTVEDQQGTPVDVALDADQVRVEEMFLKLLGK
jgi:inosine-uridine nucleoside N-ribohydrolase